MKFEFSFINNETGEFVNRDIRMKCVDKDKKLFRPEEPYTMVCIIGGALAVTMDEPVKEEPDLPDPEKNDD